MPRPSQPLLSVERIAESALAVIDEAGDFTMATLARALGVRPSSLYHHISGREEVIEAVRSLVLMEGAMTLGSHGPKSPEQRVRLILERYRDSFARHPRLIPLVTSYTISAPAVMRWYEELADQLALLGIPSERVLDVITVFDSLVLGAALDLAAPAEVWDRTQTQNPVLAAAIAASPVGRERADRAFQLGLDLVLSGLDRLR